MPGAASSLAAARPGHPPRPCRGLGAATSLAITGAVQANQPLVGALIFPVGLILIVLLGLDLVTGSFG